MEFVHVPGTVATYAYVVNTTLGTQVVGGPLNGTYVP